MHTLATYEGIQGEDALNGFRDSFARAWVAYKEAAKLQKFNPAATRPQSDNMLDLATTAMLEHVELRPTDFLAIIHAILAVDSHLNARDSEAQFVEFVKKMLAKISDELRGAASTGVKDPADLNLFRTQFTNAYGDFLDAHKLGRAALSLSSQRYGKMAEIALAYLVASPARQTREIFDSIPSMLRLFGNDDGDRNLGGFMESVLARAVVELRKAREADSRQEPNAAEYAALGHVRQTAAGLAMGVLATRGAATIVGDGDDDDGNGDYDLCHIGVVPERPQS